MPSVQTTRLQTDRSSEYSNTNRMRLGDAALSSRITVSAGAIYAQVHSVVAIQGETAFAANTATSGGNGGGECKILLPPVVSQLLRYPSNETTEFLSQT